MHMRFLGGWVVFGWIVVSEYKEEFESKSKALGFASFRFGVKRCDVGMRDRTAPYVSTYPHVVLGLCSECVCLFVCM